MSNAICLVRNKSIFTIGAKQRWNVRHKVAVAGDYVCEELNRGRSNVRVKLKCLPYRHESALS
jgi:hypothetical protein